MDTDDRRMGGAGELVLSTALPATRPRMLRWAVVVALLLSVGSGCWWRKKEAHVLTAALVTTILVPPQGESIYPYHSIVAGPDGALVLARLNVGPVEFLSQADGKPTRPPIGDAGAGANRLAASPSRLAVAAESDEVRIYDYRDTSKPIATVPPLGDFDLVFVLAFAPDGSKLAIRRGDRVQVVKGADGAVVWMSAPGAKDDPNQEITAMAFSPDGKLLAVSRHEAIELRDAEDGHVVRELGLGRAGYFATAFSPDGQRLAALSKREGMFIFRVGDGARLFDEGYIGDKYDNGRSTLYWLKDGRLVGIGRRGQLTIRDGSGKEIGVLARPGRPPFTDVEEMAVLAGEHRVALTSFAAGEDWAVRVLDLPR